MILWHPGSAWMPAFPALPDSVRQRGLYRQSNLDHLLRHASAPGNAAKLWQIAMLEAWLQTHRL